MRNKEKWFCHCSGSTYVCWLAKDIRPIDVSIWVKRKFIQILNIFENGLVQLPLGVPRPLFLTKSTYTVQGGIRSCSVYAVPGRGSDAEPEQKVRFSRNILGEVCIFRSSELLNFIRAQSSSVRGASSLRDGREIGNRMAVMYIQILESTDWQTNIRIFVGRSTRAPRPNGLRPSGISNTPRGRLNPL